MQSSGSDSPLGAQTPELRRRFVSQSRKFGRKELINHSDRLRVEEHRRSDGCRDHEGDQELAGADVAHSGQGTRENDPQARDTESRSLRQPLPARLWKTVWTAHSAI